MKTMRKRRFLSCFAAAALFTALILPGSVAADPAQTTLDMLYEPEATQYGTVIYVATTAPYGDTLGSAYNAMHNADFTGQYGGDAVLHDPGAQQLCPAQRQAAQRGQHHRRTEHHQCADGEELQG